MFQSLWEEINSKSTFEEGCLHVVEKYMPDVKVYKPLNDGVDHINIYSRGRTALGRLLSNFAYSVFEHPTHGKFASVEGYWYYLKTGCQHYHELSGLYGFRAKSVGKKFESVGHPDFDFQIELAMWCKVMQNPSIKEQLKESTLPFAHYYFYGNANNPAIRKVRSEQLQIVYEKIRKYLNRGRTQKKDTLVVLDESFTDYEFMNDKTMSGMRFLIHTPKAQVTYVRSGKSKFTDKPSFALRPGEKFIPSATPQELFELSIEHDKVVYVGGRATQSSADVKALISILHDVVSIGRF